MPIFCDGRLGTFFDREEALIRCIMCLHPLQFRHIQPVGSIFVRNAQPSLECLDLGM